MKKIFKDFKLFTVILFLLAGTLPAVAQRKRPGLSNHPLTDNPELRAKAESRVNSSSSGSTDNRATSAFRQPGRFGALPGPPSNSSYRNLNNNDNRSVYSGRYNNRVPNNYRGNNYYYRNPNYRYYYGGAYHNRPSYYRPYTRSTFGVRIGVLPANCYSFSLNRNRYYYHGGSYYRYYNNYYETIAPPYGAVVPLLPGGAILIPIGGRSYYEYAGTYYEPRVDPYGNKIYAVAGTDGILQSDRIAANDSQDIISDASIQSNMQADEVMTELPSTFKTVTLADKIYYVSPSGDYYVKLIDENGKASYQLTTRSSDQ